MEMEAVVAVVRAVAGATVLLLPLGRESISIGTEEEMDLESQMGSDLHFNSLQEFNYSFNFYCFI